MYRFTADLQLNRPCRLRALLGVHSTNFYVRTAPTILAAVKKTMAMFDTGSVTTTGHSLGPTCGFFIPKYVVDPDFVGAALSLLDALYLRLQLPTASVSFIGYGLPRVSAQLKTIYDT